MSFFPLFTCSYYKQEGALSRQGSCHLMDSVSPPACVFLSLHVFSSCFLAGCVRGHICGIFSDNICRKLEKGNVTIKRGKLIKKLSVWWEFINWKEQKSVCLQHLETSEKLKIVVTAGFTEMCLYIVHPLKTSQRACFREHLWLPLVCWTSSKAQVEFVLIAL